MVNRYNLYGIGVGPGDPELLTVKAVRCLESCPVVAYPAPMEGPSLARRIAAPYLDGRGKTEIAIRIPLVAGQFADPEIYHAAGRDLTAHLDSGRDVAVLCLGDPLLYGSFSYLLHAMPEHHHIRIIPGVSAVTAAASVAQRALAIREQSFSIIPATLNEQELTTRIAAADAMAFIKVGHHLAKLQRLLTSLGLDQYAVYIERATFEDQKYIPLSQADPRHSSYFSIVLTHQHPVP